MPDHETPQHLLYNPWTWSDDDAPIVTGALIQQCLTAEERAQRALYLAGVRDERLRVARLVQAFLQESRANGEPTFALGELLMQIVCSDTERV